MRIRSPVGVKATSTGLSMPPVMTDFDRRVARPPAEDVRRARHERRLAGTLVGLLGERALGPVDPAVGTEIGSVQIVGAAGERLRPGTIPRAVGDAVAVGVGQLPDARRRRDIQRSVEPHRAFRQHHLVGEDDARVEAAVAVRVFEPDDAVRACRRAASRPGRSIPRSRRHRAGPRRRSRRRSAGRRAEDRPRARPRSPGGL